MSSKIILTVAHLQVLWSEFWSPRAQQTTQNTPFSIASGCGQRKNGCGQKITRALRAFFMLRTPLYKILNPPLGRVYILTQKESKAAADKFETRIRLIFSVLHVLFCQCVLYTMFALPCRTTTSISRDPIAVPKQNSYHIKPDGEGNCRPKMENI